MMTQRDRERQRWADAVASWDMSDRMLWACEGGDEDEQVGRLTDEIADYLGLSKDDDEGYDELAELVADRWADEYDDRDDEQIAKDAEQAWRQLLRDEDGCDNADADYDEDDIREYAQYVLVHESGCHFGRITDEMADWAWA